MFKEVWKDDVFYVYNCVKLIRNVIFEIVRVIYIYRLKDIVVYKNKMVSGFFLNGLVGEMYVIYMKLKIWYRVILIRFLVFYWNWIFFKVFRNFLFN